MTPSKSEAKDVSKSTNITITIWKAVEEFRRLHSALKRYSIDNRHLNIDTLLQEQSTEDAINKQGFPEGSLDNAEIAFISSLAATERESDRVGDAPPGQKRGKKL